MPKKSVAVSLQGEVQMVPLDKLRFDLTNPRYGPDAPKQKSDKEALDYIMGRFDMVDVLSSISVNGFFDSEPLVGVEEAGGGIRVLEGNRRLAACLILANDPRASQHGKKRETHPLRNGVLLKKLPVIVYQQKEASQLLPYLGVRHIVGGKPWDSYAKAHWVAATLTAPGNKLALEDIKAMLGDGSGLIERLLSAYRFIEQLKTTERFKPDDSIKRGKGSAAFPFSLIYNALDNSSFRKWLGLADGGNPNRSDPVPSKRLDEAAAVVDMICGSKTRGFAPSFSDSRKIGSFVRAVQEPELFVMLKKGAPLEQVEKEALPPYERVLENLTQAMPLLSDAQEALTKTPLDRDDAGKLVPTAQKVSRLARAVTKALEGQSSEDEGDE